jgi:hypothetical protein
MVTSLNNINLSSWRIGGTNGGSELVCVLCLLVYLFIGLLFQRHSSNKQINK